MPVPTLTINAMTVPTKVGTVSIKVDEDFTRVGTASIRVGEDVTRVGTAFIGVGKDFTRSAKISQWSDLLLIIQKFIDIGPPQAENFYILESEMLFFLMKN